MTGLKGILNQLVEVAGVNVAVCVGRDGFVIDAAFHPERGTPMP